MTTEHQATTKPHQTRNLLTTLVCVGVFALAIVAYGPSALAAVGASPAPELTTGVPGDFNNGVFTFEAPVTYQARLSQQGKEAKPGSAQADEVVVVDDWTPTFYFWQLSPP